MNKRREIRFLVGNYHYVIKLRGRICLFSFLDKPTAVSENRVQPKQKTPPRPRLCYWGPFHSPSSPLPGNHINTLLQNTHTRTHHRIPKGQAMIYVLRCSVWASFRRCRRQKSSRGPTMLLNCFCWERNKTRAPIAVLLPLSGFVVNVDRGLCFQWKQSY